MAYTARLLICDVATVKGDDTVRDAAVLMRTEKVGCVVVLKGTKVAGIFSERDLLNRVVAEDRDPSATTVAEVMTRNPVTIDAADPLNKAFSILADGKFRHLPVTENEGLVGIISLSDLAKVLRQVYMDDKYLQYFADSIQKPK